MKLSRQYLLGLGSGLILSAIITMVVQPGASLSGNSSADSNTTPKSTPQAASNSSAIPSSNSSPSVTAASQEKPTTPVSPASTGISTSDPQAFAGETAKTQAKKDFVIPSGASAVKIAELLLSEGWITDKEDFLNLVKQRKLDNRFKAGTYPLVPGLSNEELLNRLVR